MEQEYIDDPNDLFTDIQSDRFKYLKLIYTLLTTQYYHGQSEAQMLTEISELKSMLSDQAELMNLRGDIKDIHSTILLDDLDKFDSRGLKSYLKLFGIQVPPRYKKYFMIKKNLELYVYYAKIMILEEFRYYQFAYDMFFLEPDMKPVAFMGYMITRDTPNVIDTLANGVYFYFPRVGECTSEELHERYNKPILIYILSMLLTLYPITTTNKEKYIINESVTKLSICDLIVDILNKMSFDPRFILTATSIVNTVGEVNGTFRQYYNIHPLADHDIDKLSSVCSHEGLKLTDDLDINLPKRVLYDSYVVSKLKKGFKSDIDKHRTINDMCYNESHTNGLSIGIFPINELVFYGVDDGVSKFCCYHVLELMETFKKYMYFYDPRSIYKNTTVKNPKVDVLKWKIFPDYTIRKLLNILKKKHILSMGKNMVEKTSSKHIEDLIVVISSIFEMKNNNLRINNKISIHNSYDRQQMIIFSIRDRIQRDKLYKMKMKDVLLIMFNVGSYLSNWKSVEYGPVPLTYDISFSHEETLENRNMDILMSIAKLHDQLNSIDDVFRKLCLMKIYNGRLVSECEERIIDRVKVMYHINKLGIYHLLCLCGNWLQSTAVYYHNIFYDISLIDTGEMQFVYEPQVPHLYDYDEILPTQQPEY